MKFGVSVLYKKLIGLVLSENWEPINYELLFELLRREKIYKISIFDIIIDNCVRFFLVLFYYYYLE